VSEVLIERDIDRGLIYHGVPVFVVVRGGQANQCPSFREYCVARGGSVVWDKLEVQGSGGNQR
jgi:hypothetical protein